MRNWICGLVIGTLFGGGITRAENWPGFRGPSRQGVSSEIRVPLEWNEKTNVVWRATIPGEGWSSPIVWEKDVFVTTTTENGIKCHLICFQREDGKILWARQLFEQVPLKKEGRNSYATPTPVTDGTTVFAVFGDGSVGAVSVNGQVRWQHREVKFYSQHGLGASPLLHGDLLIMPYDGSSQGNDKKVGWQSQWDQGFILALDKKTGKERWRGKRGLSRIAHVTPNIYKGNGREYLVSGAGDVVQGFDLKSGERLWSVESKGEGVVPSIVVGDGLVFTGSGFGDPAIRAIALPKADQPAAVAWELKKGVPMVTSMLYARPYLYAITDGGIASCLKAENGEVVWSERVGGQHSSSPVLADGRIYFLAEDGTSTVIEAGPKYLPVATNKLDDTTFKASMAVSERRLFIRGEKFLYSIGKK